MAALNDLICERCAAHFASGEMSGSQCLDCGAEVHSATRCFGCHAVIPQVAKCPRCSVPTVAAHHYESALALRRMGSELESIPGRVAPLSESKHQELRTSYGEVWRKIDSEMDRLADLLASRVNPTMGRLVLVSLDRLYTAPDATPEAILQSIQASFAQFAPLLPSIPPFSLAHCKAIHEAAAWKLGEIHWRLGAGKPPRGIEENAKQGLIHHTEALNSVYGPEDARFAVAVAYLNSFTNSHSLVFGRVYNQIDRRPVFELEKAARAQTPAPDELPVLLMPDYGVVYATGSRPTLSLSEPWVPRGFVYHGNDGSTLRLHEMEGLQAFLHLIRPTIEPHTLGALIHLLLAPFAWDTRFSFEGENLIQLWSPLEARIADWTSTGNGAGARPVGAADRREELALRLDPLGKTLVYRPPHLELR